MRINIKTTLYVPIVAFLVTLASFVSMLIVPASSAMALSPSECRDKYDGKEATSGLSDKMKADKCAISQGGSCGGTYSGGKGYISCPNTSKADTFCKKKYPENTGNQNACRSGYFSNIAGCAGLSGDKKKACEVGQDEYERIKAENAEPDEPSDDTTDPIAGNGCGGVKTAIIKCSQDNSGGVEDNGVWGLLMIVLNILTAGVGIVAVGGIVYGSILYTTAEDKADQVKKATDIITNVVIGLIAFALMWSVLNFIVPGGVFN